MKKLFFIFFLFLSVGAYAQIYPIRADTVRIYVNKVTGAELKIENSTKDSTGGLFVNIGGGRTRFIIPRQLNDSALLVGLDTFVLRGGSTETLSNATATGFPLVKPKVGSDYPIKKLGPGVYMRLDSATTNVIRINLDTANIPKTVFQAVSNMSITYHTGNPDTLKFSSTGGGSPGEGLAQPSSTLILGNLDNSTTGQFTATHYLKVANQSFVFRGSDAASSTPMIRLNNNFNAGAKTLLQFDAPVDFNVNGVKDIPFQFQQHVHINDDGSNNAVLKWGYNIDQTAEPGQHAWFWSMEPHWRSGGARYRELMFQYHNAGGEIVRLLMNTTIEGANMAGTASIWDFRGTVFSVKDLGSTDYFTVAKGNGAGTPVTLTMGGDAPTITLTDNVTSSSLQLTYAGGLFVVDNRAIKINGQTGGVNAIVSNVGGGAGRARVNYMRSNGNYLAFILDGESAGFGQDGLSFYFDEASSKMPFAMYRTTMSVGVNVYSGSVASDNGYSLQVHRDADSLGIWTNGRLAVTIIDSTASPANMLYQDPVTGQIKKAAVPAGGGGGGFSDPMAAAGDMIIRNISNSTVRLPAGTDGHVLTMVSGVPAWAAGGGGLSGSGASGQAAYFNGTSSIGSESAYTYNESTNTLNVDKGSFDHVSIGTFDDSYSLTIDNTGVANSYSVLNKGNNSSTGIFGAKSVFMWNTNTTLDAGTAYIHLDPAGNAVGSFGFFNKGSTAAAAFLAVRNDATQGTVWYSDPDRNLSVGDDFRIGTAALHVQGKTTDNSAYAFIAQNPTPTQLFRIRNDGLVEITSSASFKYSGGSPGADKVLTSDADGDATWQDAPGGNSIGTASYSLAADKTFAGSGSAEVIPLDTEEYEHNLTHSTSTNNDEITIVTGGLYTINTYATVNTSGSSDAVKICVQMWDGDSWENLPNSTSLHRIPSTGGSVGFATVNYQVYLSAASKIRFVASATSTNASLDFIAAADGVAAVPGFRVTISGVKVPPP